MFRLSLLTSIAMLANAAPMFNVQVVPLPTGFTATFTGGINSLGQMVVHTGAFGKSPSFLATPLSANQIATLGGALSYVGEPNSLGQVVGTTDTIPAQAFVATTASALGLPLGPGGERWSPLQINDAGRILGLAEGESVTVGTSTFVTAGNLVVGTTTAVSVLPAPVGAGSVQTARQNAAGQVAVTYATPGGVYSSYIVDGGGTHSPIATPAGLSNVFVVGFNNSGQIMAIGRDSMFNGVLLFGTATGLSVIPGTQGFGVIPFTLNNAGQALLGDSTGRYLWDAINGVQNLNSLVVGDWQISSPTGLNDSGQIAARAYSPSLNLTAAVRLDPVTVPEPQTGAICAAALAVAWCLSRRR